MESQCSDNQAYKLCDADMKIIDIHVMKKLSYLAHCAIKKQLPKNLLWGKCIPALLGKCIPACFLTSSAFWGRFPYVRCSFVFIFYFVLFYFLQ